MSAHELFSFRRELLGNGEPATKLASCLRQAKAAFEARTDAALLDVLLTGRPRARAALGAESKLEHFGMLLPASFKQMVSTVAGEAGFPLAHSAFPSTLFTRELGRLRGQRRLATSIFKAYGRTATGGSLAIEIFFPDTDEEVARDWLGRGVGDHVAFTVGRASFVGALAAFTAAGLKVSPFMYDRALYLPTEDVTIVYFDLDDDEHPPRIELRVIGEVNVETLEVP